MNRVALAVVAALGTLGGCVHRVVPPSPGAVAAPSEEAPPGYVTVDFFADEPEQRWDVYLDDEVLCTTPCTQTVAASAPLFLRSSRRDRLWLPGVGPEALQTQRAVVIADGTNRGEHVNGVVFTTVGGMAAVTAITFTAVGCSDLERRGGMCTAGLITGAVALPLTAVAIWMIVDGLPRAHVMPLPAQKPDSHERQARGAGEGLARPDRDRRHVLRPRYSSSCWPKTSLRNGRSSAWQKT